MSLKILNCPNPADYHSNLADCVIKTHDNQILIQKRPENWGSNAGGYNLFGGHVEQNETIIEGLIREIKEETGALIIEKELIYIGTLSEDFTNYTDAVHIYFWHDADNRITGCYEAMPAYFDKIQEIEILPKVMEYTLWALNECRNKGLIE